MDTVKNSDEYFAYYYDTCNDMFNINDHARRFSGIYFLYYKFYYFIIFNYFDRSKKETKRIIKYWAF